MTTDGTELKLAVLADKAFEHPRQKLPVRRITKIEITERGLETWHEGHLYPKKGTPDKEAIIAVDAVKRFGVALLSLFIRYPFLSKKRFIALFLDFSSKIIARYYLKREVYCSCLRPLLDFEGTKEERELLKVGVTVLQYDNAWRLRWQDLIGEYRKGKGVKELRRLLLLWKERERSDYVKRLWPAISTFLFFLPLFFSLKRFIFRVLDSLPNDVVGLDESDRYWCLLRPDYDFGGVSWEVRKSQFEQMTGMKVGGIDEYAQKLSSNA